MPIRTLYELLPAGWLCAVSYTHLDVYKRQSRNSTSSYDVDSIARYGVQVRMYVDYSDLGCSYKDLRAAQVLTFGVGVVCNSLEVNTVNETDILNVTGFYYTILLLFLFLLLLIIFLISSSFCRSCF